MTRTKGNLSPSLPRPDGDAMSLHSQPDEALTGSSSSRRAFLDDDDDAPELQIDDLPPLYSDVVSADGLSLAQAPPLSSTGLPSAGRGAASSAAAVQAPADPNDVPMPVYADEGQPVRSIVLPAGPECVGSIEHLVGWAMRQPPRPFVRLEGTHRESVNRDGKKETRTVTDFDVRVELTPYLYADARAGTSWAETRTIANGQKAYRGTVFKRYAPHYGPNGYINTPEDDAREAEAEAQSRAERYRDRPRRQLRPQTPPNSQTNPPRYTDDDNEDVEAQHLIERQEDEDDGDDDETGQAASFRRPTVKEWCQRFCEDPSRLRVLTLKREVAGLETAGLRQKLELLVRRTNYRGHLQVTFPTNDSQLDVYNDHWMNRWRIVRWIRVLFAITLLFLFAWPFLRLTTKRYEVVTTRWWFSRHRCVAADPDNSAHGTDNAGAAKKGDTKGGKGSGRSSINASNGSSSSASATAANDNEEAGPDRPHRLVSVHEYVSISEDQFYNLWGRAINKAVLEKRQKLLDQEDLRAAEGAEETFRSGNATVDSAVGFVQAGINAMSHVNRQLGWGGDSC